MLVPFFATDDKLIDAVEIKVNLVRKDRDASRLEIEMQMAAVGIMETLGDQTLILLEMDSEDDNPFEAPRICEVNAITPISITLHKNEVEEYVLSVYADCFIDWAWE